MNFEIRQIEDMVKTDAGYIVFIKNRPSPVFLDHTKGDIALRDFRALKSKLEPSERIIFGVDCYNENGYSFAQRQKAIKDSLKHSERVEWRDLTDEALEICQAAFSVQSFSEAMFLGLKNRLNKFAEVLLKNEDFITNGITTESEVNSFKNMARALREMESSCEQIRLATENVTDRWLKHQ